MVRQRPKRFRSVGISKTLSQDHHDISVIQFELWVGMNVPPRLMCVFNLGRSVSSRRDFRERQLICATPLLAYV
jgi:hypothetical protein